MVSQKNKVIFLELNEFSPELLTEASEQLELKNLQKLTQMRSSVTESPDTYESDYLEPWVQWVSVHTGRPSSEHQIKHLGDVPHLEIKQMWEILSDKHITSGVWGAMNASKGNAGNCLFFLPDPWTASERAYPEELNTLLNMLRLSSKNYLNLPQVTLLKMTGALLSFVWSKGLFWTALKEIPNLVRTIRQYPGEAFPFISLFDYLSMLLFLRYKRDYNPDFSLIFLNSLAHLQHHHWRGFDYKSNPRLTYGLQYLDRLIGQLQKSLSSDDTLIVTNALSQTNTNTDKPWILYRQKDQAEFLKEVGVAFKSVEAHMTHDAHIYFENEAQAVEAKRVLEEARINGQRLFEVEDYSQDRSKLFYRVIFTDELQEEAELVMNGNKFRFFNLFKPVVKRTGKHIQQGMVYSNRSIFPERVANHEVINYVVKQFDPLFSGV